MGEITYNDVPATNRGGQFSMVWGIVICVLSFILLILSAVALGAFTHLHELAYVSLIGSILLMIFSIITLVIGIKSIRISPRVRAIIGTAFAVQNIFVLLYVIVLSWLALVAHEEYHSSYDYPTYHYNDSYYYDDDISTDYDASDAVEDYLEALDD